jgi:MFS family permease
MRQDMSMAGKYTARRSTAGRVVGTTIRGARATVRGSGRFTRWVARYVLFFRTRAGAGEVGMMRLLDLHAASCAGDTLVTMGLASTVFFAVPAGEARARVALYLFITMVPFALLAPVVGPMLDRFRHGRRYALAVTMLGRAFLAWLISDYLGNFGLYPAAFGVLALSRAYGVARSAAVPRLLPPTMGLSQAGARASIFGTVAGAAVAPLGVAALTIGPQWPLRVAAVIFVAGAVVALRLPPRADSEPPEIAPRIFQMPGRRSVKVLSGALITATLTGSGALRALYGYLALFLAFTIRSKHMPTELFGHTFGAAQALGLAAGSLGVGSLVATAVGARLRIRRPLALQAVGLALVALVAILATLEFGFGVVVLLAFVVATVSGLAKLAVDATIQERIDEDVRASAFAHSETLLMLAWVAGGAVGLIPFGGRLGIGVAAVGITVAAVFAWMRAVTMRRDKLTGQAKRAAETVDLQAPTRALPAGSPPAGSAPVAPTRRTTQTGLSRPRRSQGTTAEATRWGRRRAAKPASEPPVAPTSPAGPAGPTEAGQPVTRVLPRAAEDQPGFHLYRPSGTEPHDGDANA